VSEIFTNPFIFGYTGLDTKTLVESIPKEH